MMNTKKTMVFLAGGMGSRYKSLKQVDGMLENGSPIMEYSLYDGIDAGFNKFVFIISDSVPQEYIDRINKITEERQVECHWVIQRLTDFVPENLQNSEREKPWGTGHALLCVKDVVKENFLIVNADDFYGRKSFETAFQLCNEQQVTPTNYALVAYQLNNTLSENGSVSRGLCTVGTDSQLVDIEELTKIKSHAGRIFAETAEGERDLQPNDLVSMNFWVFNPSVFAYLEADFRKFLDSKPALKTEFILPEIIRTHLLKNEISVKVERSHETWKGVTYPEDKKEVQVFLKTKMEGKLYPENLWS